MKATWNGAVIAETDETIVVDGNHYFPESALNREFLTESKHTSVCPWKGTARYYSINVQGETNENAAWYYPEAKEEARHIQGRVAFWRGVEVSE
jgi:uncharacterized protein (DUF427 family)